jgi:hypothetical protein
MLMLLFVLVVGPISTAAMRAYCTLTPPVEFRHSSPEALHTKRRERPLLAKDGTKAKEVLGSFTSRKAVDMGHIFYFPSEGRHA